MENEMIRLEPADEALATETAEYYNRNKEFLRAFEPKRSPEFFTCESQRGLLKEEVLAFKAGTSYRFYIREKATGLLIGSIGLNNIVRGAFQSSFLGYKLDGSCVNRGYMTMAVGMMTQYAFKVLGLHRVEANVMPRNGASLRVLQKNGYVNEGIARKYLLINGVWEDHIHMVRLNEEEQ